MTFIIGRFKSFKCIQHIYLLIPYHVSVIMLGNGKIKLSNDRYSSEICIYIYIYISLKYQGTKTYSFKYI